MPSSRASTRARAAAALRSRPACNARPSGQRRHRLAAIASSEGPPTAAHTDVDEITRSTLSDGAPTWGIGQTDFPRGNRPPRGGPRSRLPAGEPQQCEQAIEDLARARGAIDPAPRLGDGERALHLVRAAMRELVVPALV